MCHKRRGFVIAEVIVASGLLAVLIAIVLQALGAIAAERRATEKRTAALAEAANIMEQVTSLSWREIDESRLNAIATSPSLEKIAPGLNLKVGLEPVSSSPPAKHVWVNISWPNNAGRMEAPVRLDYFAYALPGERVP